MEIFSRSSVRPSISLRIDSIETWARGKKRPVSVLSSRINPSSRCSGSMAGAPKLRRFVASEENYAARFFGVAFEHWSLIVESGLNDYHAGLRTGSPGTAAHYNLSTGASKGFNCGRYCIRARKVVTEQLFQPRLRSDEGGHCSK